MTPQRIKPALYCIGQDPARDARLLARLFPRRPAPRACHLPAVPRVPFTLPPLEPGARL